MAGRHYQFAFALLVATSASAWGQEEKPQGEAAEQRIAELIKQLDAPKLPAREAAIEELRKIGEPALAPLEKAAATTASIEAKFRAQTAIDRIKLDLARQNAIKIDDILAEAKAAQKEGWKSDELMKKLDALVRVVSEQTKTGFKLPVTAQQANQPPMGQIANNSLIKEKRVKISQVTNSIVLCESIADISVARNSIVIAPVAAIISTCEDSLVISGQLLYVSHPQKSMLLCNSRTETSFVRESILAGQEGVIVSSYAEGSTFINAPVPVRPGVAITNRAQNKSVQVEGILFGEKAPPSPLEGKLKVTLAAQLGEPLILFRLPDGTGEYVARYEKEITTPQGQPIGSLAGWKLIYAGNNVAVFASGDQTAFVRVGM